MKSIITITILLLAGIAQAASLHTEWTYPETEGLTGFSLMGSDNTVAATFDAIAREGDFDYALNECTGFYMTAQVGGEDSPISPIYTMCPKEPDPPPPFGSFIITIAPAP